LFTMEVRWVVIEMPRIIPIDFLVSDRGSSFENVKHGTDGDCLQIQVLLKSEVKSGEKIAYQDAALLFSPMSSVADDIYTYICIQNIHCDHEQQDPTSTCLGFGYITL